MTTPESTNAQAATPPELLCMQDEVGQMMADALNALYQVPPSNAGAEPREASASGNLLEGESTQPKDEK